MKLIDDALIDWDEAFRFKPRKGRVCKLTLTRSKVSPPDAAPLRVSGASAARAKLNRIIRKAPEVMVKVSGGGRGMGRIKAHFDYISRNGDVVLENEAGQIIAGCEAVRDLRDEWKFGLYGIPEESHRKEAFNIVLSMPPGTDRNAVTDAARAFATAEFGNNHQYVFATHHDEAHPHVHLCVKAQGVDGTRLNPRKPDLQRWRERFAEALHEHGIDANATPRGMRGSRHRTVKQANRHAAPSPIPQERAVRAAAPPAQTIRRYAALARVLARGEAEDRSLAIAITKIVSSMQHSQAAERASKTPTLRHDAVLSRSTDRSR